MFAYDSISDMQTDAKNTLTIMERDMRQELVCVMKHYGLNVRSIAKILGTSDSTASRLCDKCSE